MNPLTVAMLKANEISLLDPLFKATAKVYEAAYQNTKVLDLHDMNIDSLPEEIYQLTTLEELILSDNKLITLPDQLTRLTNLRTLNIGGNTGIDIPQWLTKLSILMLGCNDCHFESLPQVIFHMTKLRTLQLSHNLASLPVPSAIGNLTNLAGLRLEFCYLTSLPLSMTSLVHLEELDLYHNNLKEIPSFLGFMNLRVLDVSSNQLSWLPESLKNVPYIRLCNNPGYGTFIETEKLIPSENMEECSVPPLLDITCGQIIGEYGIDNENLREYLPDTITGQDFHRESPGYCHNCGIIVYGHFFSVLKNDKRFDDNSTSCQSSFIWDVGRQQSRARRRTYPREEEEDDMGMPLRYVYCSLRCYHPLEEKNSIWDSVFSFLS